MRYLIMEDNYPSMLALPAKETREEAEKEVERLNKIVQKNNDEFLRFEKELKTRKPHHGEVFLYRKDDRVFSIKEIE